MEKSKLHTWIEEYKIHISAVRRYSEGTCRLYGDCLARFEKFVGEEADDITPATVRNYEVHLLDTEHLSAKTTNVHLSVLSSFCAFLVRNEQLKMNPVKATRRPKIPKRLPEFYRQDSLNTYFAQTDIYASREFLDAFRAAYSASHSEGASEELSKACLSEAKELYNKRLQRVVISTLLNLGIRRSELIGMNIGDLDTGRKVVTIRGKGDKMREIPVIDSLCEEILLYLEAVETLVGGKRDPKDAMFVTFSLSRLYPVFVDRTVKGDFSALAEITGRRSPHVLRHTLATGLLDEGTGLNSIKQMLGHSSLATTQIYTHNSIVKLKNIYKSAHPRAKKGGNYGD